LTELHQLEESIAYWEANDTFEIFERSVRIHYLAVHIHPFLNGNGRWSRLLGNIYLRQNDHPLVQWPDEVIGTESPVRNEYLDAVKKADIGHLDDLINLHRKHCQIE
jgi:Fic family protein